MSSLFQAEYTYFLHLFFIQHGLWFLRPSQGSVPTSECIPVHQYPSELEQFFLLNANLETAYSMTCG